MKKRIALAVITLVTGIAVSAQISPVFVNEGKAIRGYDPVAYFTEKKPVLGKEDLKFNWNNVNWYFSSPQNLDSFKINPVKYAPQYGGYCAFGLSDGHKAPTQPDAWTIVNGKLYLNYNTKVREYWKKDQQERIEKADINWPGIKDKE